ncbi:hypothetical protein KCP71_11335 [Salmonella enterica subsp. enterica]|nr:hypothetical protein KCP71_11335 [Salmonella enterica subsp. enterica]
MLGSARFYRRYSVKFRAQHATVIAEDEICAANLYRSEASSTCGYFAAATRITKGYIFAEQGHASSFSGTE